jgi:hypothetical protein
MDMKIYEMSDEQLRELAVKNKIEIPPAVKDRTKLIQYIGIGLTKIEEDIRNKANASIAVDVQNKLSDAGIKIPKGYSTPESQAIDKSKKVYAIFNNIVNPGCCEQFNPGLVHKFQCYDGQVHVLPEALIEMLTKTSRGTSPVHKQVRDPATGQIRAERVSVERNYSFQVLSDAPTDSKFGVVTDIETLTKLDIKDRTPVTSVKDLKS